MNVLFYIPVMDKKGKRILAITGGTALEADTEICKTIESLSHCLRQPLCLTTFVVLYAPRSKDLQALLSIKELLQDVYVLLILPDRLERTISKGHLLRPRFLTYADANLGEVGLVLEKMIENYGKIAGGLELQIS